MVCIGSAEFSPPVAAAQKLGMRFLRGVSRHLVGGGSRVAQCRRWFAGYGFGSGRKEWLVLNLIAGVIIRMIVRIRSGLITARSVGTSGIGPGSLSNVAGVNRRGSQSPARSTFRRGGSRRQDRLHFLRLSVVDFVLDLRPELVGSAAELVESLAHLAGDLRQLLGPKDDEGQKEQEDRLGKTHGFHHTAGNGK